MTDRYRGSQVYVSDGITDVGVDASTGGLKVYTVGGAGSGGGAVTIANGGDTAQGSTTDAPAASPATAAAATEIALLKQIANNTSAATSNAVVPTTTVDPTNTFTQPTGDTAARAIFTATQGQIADGATASGVSSLSVGSPDSGGLMRTPQTNLASTTPISTATYGLQTNSVLFGNSSANTLRALVTASGFTAGGSGANSLTVAECRAVTSTTYEQVYNNQQATLLASAARTTTQTSADIINQNGRVLLVTLNVTVNTIGSITLTIDGKDNIGTYYNILTGLAVITTGFSTYVVGIGATTAANAAIGFPLPRTFRIVVTANNANSVTYSSAYNILV